MPNQNPPSLLQNVMGTVAFLLVFGSVVVWAVVARHWRRRQPVVPYQPRRRVPWGAFDVALLILLYQSMPALVLMAAQPWFDIPAVAAEQTTAESELDNVHPLARVLLESHGRVWPILLCVVSAVVVAPITEEFVFRLLLQGWLERLERRLRRRIASLRGGIVGLVPVATVAIFFSMRHLREPTAKIEFSTIVFLLGVQAVASLLTVALSAFWLKFAVGATLTDFGIVPNKLAGDIRLGLLAFLAVMPPIYAMMYGVKSFLPTVADPLFLLPLAAVLGILYFRTHRIVPSVALHMAFNAAGVLLAFAASTP